MVTPLSSSSDAAPEKALHRSLFERASKALGRSWATLSSAAHQHRAVTTLMASSAAAIPYLSYSSSPPDKISRVLITPILQSPDSLTSLKLILPLLPVTLILTACHYFEIPPNSTISLLCVCLTVGMYKLCNA